MLNAKRLLYTRSLANDYRWVYYDNQLEQEDKINILSDYEKFEKDSSSYFNENHLIVRLTKKGIAFYKFVETERTDQNARKILGLIGIAFSGFEFEIVKILLNFVVAYLFIKRESFEFIENEIKDSMENMELSTMLSLDKILNECKNNIDINEIAQRIDTYMIHNKLCSFIIKENSISPILLTEKQPELMTQCLIQTSVNIEHNSTFNANQSNTKEFLDKNKFEEICDLFKIKKKKQK